jgi:hypothetical protein
MTFAGVYAYVAASPLLLQQVYGFSARSFALFYLATRCVSSRVCRRRPCWHGDSHSARPGRLRGPDRGGRCSDPAAAERGNRAGACVPLALVAGCGGCSPCAEVIALADQGQQAGTATSVHLHHRLPGLTRRWPRGDRGRLLGGAGSACDLSHLSVHYRAHSPGRPLTARFRCSRSGRA